MYIVTSAFFQISDAFQDSPSRAMRYACVPCRVPDTMSAEPVQTGVTMFSCHSSGNGDVHSSRPVAASSPTIDPFVIATTCRTPLISITIGDA